MTDMAVPADETGLLAAGWKPYPKSGGFEDHVGPIYHNRTPEGRMRFGFRCLRHHINPQGVVHGGMLVTFIDHVLGGLVWYRIGKKPCLTVSLNCDFVASAKQGDWVEGQGELVRQGKSLVFVRGLLTANDRAVLRASGIWKIIGAN